ncbi:HAMP domain-containing histidine kinase [Paenibacillus sp. SC116]|uniref:sensor histidine kinase n=1 Tax=Paenibacillus sp. SC116 TaxID=2968986 RepID=UPI00215B3E9B|nr:HAMP domain-containing sensor histidine kinase [Paenibacillus sp. SC116]MCR8846140.1 HAMP domain-containing histidine kinase [Paenibacillus sp. SC116]
MKQKQDRMRRFFEPNSLRFQLLSRSLFVLSGLLLLIGIVQYTFMKQFLYQNKAESLLSQVRNIPYQLWEYTDQMQGKNEYVDALLSLRTPDVQFALVYTDGYVKDLFVDPYKKGTPRMPEAIYTEVLESGICDFKYKITEDEHGGEHLVVLQPIKTDNKVTGIVQVSSPIGSLTNVLIPQLITFLGASLLALLIGLFMYLSVLRRTLNPLSHMERTVEHINSGNLAQRLPVDQGQLEIDRVSIAFNGMLERLEQSFKSEQEAKEQMRRFVADASHELRTPLTSIRGFLEVLMRGAASNPERLGKALKSMHGEAERLHRLVEDLLSQAKLDREPIIQLQSGPIDRVIFDMEHQLLLLAGDRKVRLDIEKDVQVWFDRDMIKQVILNLFHNAVQHTNAKEGVILLTLRHIEDRVEIDVKDNGVGIAPEHVPHVFERFYRIDSSRTRKWGGAGLGLSITKSIVDKHNGSLQVESELGKGTLFRVILPSVNQSAGAK